MATTFVRAMLEARTSQGITQQQLAEKPESDRVTSVNLNTATGIHLCGPCSVWQMVWA